MINVEIRIKIEKKLDKIVEMAESAVPSNEQIKKISDTQLRNIQNMANSTYSVKALENFIAYQVGRKKIPKEFKDKIISDFNNLKQLSIEIAGEENSEVHMELIRLYLGFLVRGFKYKKGEK